jgi:hypothetical protein
MGTERVPSADFLPQTRALFIVGGHTCDTLRHLGSLETRATSTSQLLNPVYKQNHLRIAPEVIEKQVTYESLLARRAPPDKQAGETEQQQCCGPGFRNRRWRHIPIGINLAL